VSDKILQMREFSSSFSFLTCVVVSTNSSLGVVSGGGGNFTFSQTVDIYFPSTYDCKADSSQHPQLHPPNDTLYPLLVLLRPSSPQHH